MTSPEPTGLEAELRAGLVKCIAFGVDPGISNKGVSFLLDTIASLRADIVRLEGERDEARAERDAHLRCTYRSAMVLPFRRADPCPRRPTARGDGEVSTREMKPVGWLDDGTLRAGSENTAFRVVTDAQKADMPSAVQSSFNTALYSAEQLATIEREALERAAKVAEELADDSMYSAFYRKGARTAARHIRSLSPIGGEND